MRHFKYQNSKQMSKVWMLFKDLKGCSLEQLEAVYSGNNSHTLEIIKAALNGSFLLSDESVRDFNLQGYEYSCTENDRIGLKKKAKDELHIVDFSNGEEDCKVGYGDISSRKLAYLEDSFNEVINSEAFEQSMMELLNIRSKYIIEEGIDIIQILLSALKGIPEAKDTLTEYVKNDSFIETIVKTLCDNGHGSLIGRLEAIISKPIRV